MLEEGPLSYVYGPGGLPLAQVDATKGDSVLYYHHDQLGSTRMLSDATASVVARYRYDAYGRPSATTATPAVANSFGYAGEYTDAETGFQYLRARHYDPATGQFLSRDPVTALTQEPYGYIGGSPLNATDPSGLFRIPGTNICIDIADPICVTAIEGQPNHIADLAAGVLEANPITAATNALGLTDTSQYAGECSGWYKAGQVSMAVVDIAIPVHAGGKVLANGNNFLRIGRGRISIGPARNHWKHMSKIDQRIFRHHIHVERRYGGIDNWVRSTNRTWWKNG